ncbi:methylenetetrahydrofolate reductase [Verrucomicrobiota bacterium]
MSTESQLAKALNEGKFVATAELGPPKTADAEVVKKKHDMLKGCVTAVNITDNQTAVVRASSIACACMVMPMGTEPVIQITCRDRNRLAIQSDVLGAAAAGIRNVLCLTGDHQKFGNHPQARGVFDLDSIQLIQMLRNMRDERKFECGEDIKNSKKEEPAGPELFIGAAANPFGDPFEARVIRLAKKVEAGAQFIQTQPVFDIDVFQKWMDGVRARGLDKKTHILAGVMPIKSFRVLEYMNKNVPGIRIPEHLITRMKDAEVPKEEGVKICVEMIDKLKTFEGVHGVHIMAVEWEEVVSQIVKESGLA